MSQICLLALQTTEVFLGYYGEDNLQLERQEKMGKNEKFRLSLHALFGNVMK